MNYNCNFDYHYTTICREFVFHISKHFEAASIEETIALERFYLLTTVLLPYHLLAKVN